MFSAPGYGMGRRYMSNGLADLRVDPVDYRLFGLYQPMQGQ